MQKKARKMEYLSPKVSVSAFALEKGFALSVATEQFNLGYPYPGEQVDAEYNDAAGSTESLGNDGISF